MCSSSTLQPAAQRKPRRTWRLTAALSSLVLGISVALAQSAPPSVEPGATIEVLGAELSSQKQAAEEATARAISEAEGLRKELGAIRAKLQQTQADAQAKADAVAGLQKTRADLEAQLAAARKETDAARAAVQKAQSEVSAKAAAIATLEQGRAELQAAIEAERAKLAAAERAANERFAAAERKTKAEADARGAAEREITALTQKLVAAEKRLAVAESERSTVSARLDAALAKVPARDGGTKTAALARAKAAEAATAFVAASEQARKQPGDATKAILRDAGLALQQAQYDVAVTIDARGVYRLREEDTLGMVAGRFYGTGNKWPAIYEANQHVLANPDRMLPGMTLVVP